MGELSGYSVFAGSMIGFLAISLVYTVCWLTVLLVGRLLGLRSLAAWAVLAATIAGLQYSIVRPVMADTVSSAVLIAVVAAQAMLLAWLLWRHGALALAVAYYTFFAMQIPIWTLNMSRWYAWQGATAAAIVVALALWGFRNVLGKQSAFPAGALDG
jgi:hypothetical protein